MGVSAQQGGHDPGCLNLSRQGGGSEQSVPAPGGYRAGKGASGSADCLQCPGDQGLGLVQGWALKWRQHHSWAGRAETGSLQSNIHD